MTIRILPSLIIAQALLIGSLAAHAESYGYAPARVVIQDAQLAEYEQPGVSDPDTEADFITLPDGPVYSGQSLSTLDTVRDIRGYLVITTEPGSPIIQTISYSIEACMDAQQMPGESFVGTRECYMVSDTATVVDFTSDGRIYTVINGFGSRYDIHFVRRETDPDASDPSAIFQIRLQQPDRAVTLLMFYQLDR